MSTKGFAKRRDKNESLVVAVLEAMGARVVRLSDKGVPDLLVGHRGLTYLVEVKGSRGKLTPDQEQWHAAWPGSKIAVVITPEDAVQSLMGSAAVSVGDAGVWAWCPSGCGGARPGCIFEKHHERGTYPRVLKRSAK